ncbi:MAG TPA: PilZ domain-containing protein [Gammaproteobacteria bacterium]|nr:PilZ domain-containing protein [Gammaproteobacteria bacterium]
MNVRVPVSVDVGIEYPGNEFVPGQADNVSFEGMYVRTDRSALPPYGFVRIAFIAHSRHRTARVQVPAIVVRRTSDGLGVMFTDYDDHVFEGLSHLMQGHFEEELERHALPR